MKVNGGGAESEVGRWKEDGGDQQGPNTIHSVHADDDDQRKNDSQYLVRG